MISKKLFEELKKAYTFDSKIFYSLSDEFKLRYMYNYIDWKCIEANELGNVQDCIKYFNLKTEIYDSMDVNKVMQKYGKTTFDETLYKKEIEQIVRKIKLETDFLNE